MGHVTYGPKKPPHHFWSGGSVYQCLALTLGCLNPRLDDLLEALQFFHGQFLCKLYGLVEEGFSLAAIGCMFLTCGRIFQRLPLFLQTSHSPFSFGRYSARIRRSGGRIVTARSPVLRELSISCSSSNLLTMERKERSCAIAVRFNQSISARRSPA